MESHVGFIMSLVVVWVFLLTLHSLPMGTMAAGLNPQRQEVAALIDFKNHVKDPANYIFESWVSTDDSACEWLHIECKNTGRVLEVSLGGDGLSGTISPSLGNLDKLQYLRLWGNKLHGGIPSELGKLADLIKLDLSSNKLTGPIPNSFGNLKSAKFIKLENNDLSGLVPWDAFNKLKTQYHQIQVLTFWNNPNLHCPKDKNCDFTGA